jgi:hypothetical protein
MNEKEFLNAVLQAAGKHPLNHSGEPSQYEKAWDSGERWEIQAQIEIYYHVKRYPGVKSLSREESYPGTREDLDLYFELDGETYAVELKVESPKTGMYGGAFLEDAIRMDVEKLKGFKADHRWMVVIAVSTQHQLTLKIASEWENSLFVDSEGDFVGFLCNIDKYPHALPFQFSNSIRMRGSSNFS